MSMRALGEGEEMAQQVYRTVSKSLPINEWRSASEIPPRHPDWEDKSIDVLLYGYGSEYFYRVGYYDFLNEWWTDGEFDRLNVIVWRELPPPPDRIAA